MCSSGSRLNFVEVANDLEKCNLLQVIHSMKCGHVPTPDLTLLEKSAT